MGPLQLWPGDELNFPAREDDAWGLQTCSCLPSGFCFALACFSVRAASGSRSVGIRVRPSQGISKVCQLSDGQVSRNPGGGLSHPVFSAETAISLYLPKKGEEGGKWLDLQCDLATRFTRRLPLPASLLALAKSFSSKARPGHSLSQVSLQYSHAEGQGGGEA